jgi:hypothetical protein
MYALADMAVPFVAALVIFLPAGEGHERSRRYLLSKERGTSF